MADGAETKEGNEMTEGFDSGMLAGLMSNHGVDPGILALMNDCRNNGNWDGNNGGFLILFLLLILMGGRNGFGWGSGDLNGVAGIDRTVVNEANYGQMMDAIRGNRAATERLADTLNCDVNQLQMALCGVDKQLAINHGDIINAVQSCCCNVRTEIMQSQNAIQSQMAKCCCDTNLNIERQSNELQRQIQETRFQIQTTDAATRQMITQQFCDQNAYLAQQFCDIKLREDARQIQDLRDKLEEARADARTASVIAAVNGTKCFNGRYDSTTSTICGSVGARNCCCNRISTTTTAPAASATEAAEVEASVAKASKKSS